MNIEGSVAIVTGGSSGLGRATSEALVARGAKVAILDLNEEAGAAVVAELGSESSSFHPVDVRDATSVEEAVAAACDQWGTVHILVNCAGVAPARRVLERDGSPSPLASFQSVIDINLVGTFNVARVAASAMAKNTPTDDSGERGVIVSTASVAGFEGQIGQSAYAASKGGVIALTLPMARDLAKLGIRVNAIAPGTMGTPMLLGMPEGVQESLISNIPFPHRLGYPAEFAALALHLVENGYINGEVVRIDGALRMQPK